MSHVWDAIAQDLLESLNFESQPSSYGTADETRITKQENCMGWKNSYQTKERKKKEKILLQLYLIFFLWEKTRQVLKRDKATLWD